MKARSPSLDAYQRETVRAWWKALQPQAIDQPRDAAKQGRFRFDRGDRAQLRRASEADDLLMARAANELCHALYPQTRAEDESHGELDMATFERVALAAGVLAHVKDDVGDGKTLASRLSAREGTEGRAAMSDIRFKRLLKTSSVDDLYLQLVRAVKLGKGTADVAQLADDVLTWLAQAHRTRVEPARSVKLHWAHDYYLNAKERAASASELEKESNT